MKKVDKFYSLCKRYRVFIPNINHEYLDELAVKHIMIKAHERHPDVPFEKFVRSCMKDPVNFLYDMSESLYNEVYELNLLNNCFNDGNSVHYGLKVDGVWYFITHSKNNFSLPLGFEEFKIRPKDLVGTSYLTTRANVAPNILRWNVGTLRKHVIAEYNRMYLGK